MISGRRPTPTSEEIQAMTRSAVGTPDHHTTRRNVPRPSAVIRGLAIAATASALLAGCTAPSGATTEADDESSFSVVTGGEGTPEVDTVRVGFLPTASYAAFALAQRDGYFEDEGITVETQPATVSPIAPLVGGSLDIAGGTWIEFYVALSQGIELSALADVSDGQPGLAEILVRADSDYESIADLVDEQVAIITSPGVCDALALDVLHDAGVEGSPQFTVFPIPDMWGALERGDVQAACVPEPLLNAMKADGGFRSVLDLWAAPYEGQPVTGFFASTSFAKDNPNTVGAFQRALARAAAYLNEHPDLTAEVLATYTAITPEQAAALTPALYPETVDVTKLQTLAELVERVGLTEQVIDVGDGSTEGSESE
jgi:NitT/TauT family transport system substrate-binding protein